MSYEVLLTENARKALRKMDRSSASAIYSWISKNLAGTDDPRRTGKALKGGFKGVWRYRVGDFRLFALIDDGKLIIFIIDIRNREHAYDGELDLESLLEALERKDDDD